MPSARQNYLPLISAKVQSIYSQHPLYRRIFIKLIAIAIEQAQRLKLISPVQRIALE
jgi:hypothetical protein